MEQASSQQQKLLAAAYLHMKYVCSAPGEAFRLSVTSPLTVLRLTLRQLSCSSCLCLKRGKPTQAPLMISFCIRPQDELHKQTVSSPTKLAWTEGVTHSNREGKNNGQNVDTNSRPPTTELVINGHDSCHHFWTRPWPVLHGFRLRLVCTASKPMIRL